MNSCNSHSLINLYLLYEGHDETQGQFFSWFEFRGSPFPRLVAITKTKSHCLCFDLLQAWGAIDRFMPFFRAIFVSASHQTGIDKRFFYSEGLGRRRSAWVEARALLNVCWSSAHFVQCEPDEPRLGLTQ